MNFEELACEDPQGMLLNFSIGTASVEITIFALYHPTDDDNALVLCGTNGVTYSSLCHLLQDTGNEGVAYVGACGSEECNGGQVSTISERVIWSDI